MKLLLDQNLSPKLTGRLADVYPNSEHVGDVGLSRALDREVWAHAKQGEFAIVSKDSDFSELSVLLGFPPNVVWIRRDNCSTAEIEKMLRENRAAVERLGGDPEAGVLALY